MKRFLKSIPLMVLSVMTAFSAFSAPKQTDKQKEAAEVRSLIAKVNNYWLKNNPAEVRSF